MVASRRRARGDRARVAGASPRTPARARDGAPLAQLSRRRVALLHDPVRARIGRELEQWRAIKRDATEAIVAAGGTLSHHHGVGVDHQPWLAREKGALGVDALRAVKRAVDPDGRTRGSCCERAGLVVGGAPRPLSRAERDGVDVLVVGGGIVGAGVLRDAASRGLRALLVERGDFASGTSSRSSKMVHGGLRYLAHGHLASRARPAASAICCCG